MEVKGNCIVLLLMIIIILLQLMLLMMVILMLMIVVMRITVIVVIMVMMMMVMMKMMMINIGASCYHYNEIRRMDYFLGLDHWKSINMEFVITCPSHSGEHLLNAFGIMMTSSNGNIFRVTGLCAGNSPVPVNSPHKGQWRGALMFSLICVWINGWVNSRRAGDLRRYLGHYDVIVMYAM